MDIPVSELPIQPLTFRPLDLSKHADLALKFVVETHICSFGNADRFYRDCEPDGRKYIEHIRKKLAKDPMAIVHVWRGQQIIGQLETGVYKFDHKCGYVNLYYLVPEARGVGGYSAALDAYAVQVLRAKGFRQILLTVSPSNARAVRYYSRMGWQLLGPRTDAPEVYLMEKRI
jgi:hypothetical protein